MKYVNKTDSWVISSNRSTVLSLKKMQIYYFLHFDCQNSAFENSEKSLNISHFYIASGFCNQEMSLLKFPAWADKITASNYGTWMKKK